MSVEKIHELLDTAATAAPDDAHNAPAGTETRQGPTAPPTWPELASGRAWPTTDQEWALMGALADIVLGASNDPVLRDTNCADRTQ